MKKRSLSVILSTVLGLVFILSGFVKAVDPVGFSYKIEEYLSMFGMYGMKEWSVPLAVMSCAMETFLGMIVLFDQNLEHVSTDIGNNGKPAYMIGVRKNIDDNTISKIECLHKA